MKCYEGFSVESNVLLSLPFQFAAAQSPSSEAELNAPTISNSSSLSVTPKRTASVGTADAPIGGGGGRNSGATDSSSSSSVFSPIVTATCRTGIMTIKVETLNNFIGVVHSRDYREEFITRVILIFYWLRVHTESC